ncbi:hypothetical protein TNCT_118581 [Trichonephila clavata]|uniref:Uncharacterized protein n=1 Tax=Trichonephila clavata TaxID=2740835 RepID=A0A8X6HJN1_TRICU|nr:hypothetical protein TNCT_118581 [Trichonephila clavata]
MCTWDNERNLRISEFITRGNSTRKKSTLKEVILVKLAAEFVNDYDTRKIIIHSEEEIWKKVIRERISAFNIPLTLNEELIVLLKSMAIDVAKWRSDHNGIVTK